MTKPLADKGFEPEAKTAELEKQNKQAPAKAKKDMDNYVLPAHAGMIPIVYYLYMTYSATDALPLKAQLSLVLPCRKSTRKALP